MVLNIILQNNLWERERILKFEKSYQKQFSYRKCSLSTILELLLTFHFMSLKIKSKYLFLLIDIGRLKMNVRFISKSKQMQFFLLLNKHNIAYCFPINESSQLQPKTLLFLITNIYDKYYYQKTKQMSFRQLSNNQSYKKTIRPARSPKGQTFLKNSKSISEAKAIKLFQSGRLLEPKSSKEVEFNGKPKPKLCHKVFTTDQSNNQMDSNMQESIYVSQKMPNEQYFQQPLSFKPKKYKGAGSKRQMKNNKIENLNLKLNQMNQLVRSQDKELKQMKNSMSQRELNRLIKMHSIQKLKLLESINQVRNTSQKNVIKG